MGLPLFAMEDVVAPDGSIETAGCRSDCGSQRLNWRPRPGFRAMPYRRAHGCGARHAGAPARHGRDHHPRSAVGGVRAAGLRLVPGPASAVVRRPDRRGSGQGRTSAGREGLPRSDRGWRIRVRLRGKVYRAHHPRWAYLATSGEGAALHGGASTRRAWRPSTPRAVSRRHG